jgi:wyosine [tRNA(Phe)-imidazoG37] synthetase (radical SAM superfamily)
MPVTSYRYLFGPVPSRRLGRSLGVDLTPVEAARPAAEGRRLSSAPPCKVCTLDCVFCQLGAAHGAVTTARGEFAPLEAVTAEFDRWWREDGQADYVTLSGTGEPTLHARFGAVVEHVRAYSSLPVALLSNGTLFTRPAVRAAAARANLVKLSLSAWDQISFQRVNRPHADLDFAAILDGYRAFRAQFAGVLWLEVFLVPGLNTQPEQVARMAALARDLRPEQVQLNTAVRPPAESFVAPLEAAEMERLALLFEPPAESIAAYRGRSGADAQTDPERILALLRRHAATVSDLAAMSGRAESETLAALQALTAAGRVRTITREGRVYFVPEN